jgi:hypothetical protein
MAAMVNSIKQSMIMSLRKFKTAKQIWSALKQRYVQGSGALLFSIISCSKFMSLSKVICLLMTIILLMTV